MQTSPIPEVTLDPQPCTTAGLEAGEITPGNQPSAPSPSIASHPLGSSSSEKSQTSVPPSAENSPEKSPDKQKFTVYFLPSLHRQLKIRSAVESTPMSSLVERAVAFYLEHPEVVDEYDEQQGQTYRVYSCPACHTSTVLRDGELVALRSSPSLLADDRLDTLAIERAIASRAESARSGESPEDEDREDRTLLVSC